MSVRVQGCFGEGARSSIGVPLRVLMKGDDDVMDFARFQVDEVVVRGVINATFVVAQRGLDAGSEKNYVDGAGCRRGNGLALQQVRELLLNGQVIYPGLAEVAEVFQAWRGGQRYPERVYASIDDLDLCTALKARRWSMAR